MSRNGVARYAQAGRVGAWNGRERKGVSVMGVEWLAMARFDWAGCGMVIQV